MSRTAVFSGRSVSLLSECGDKPIIDEGWQFIKCTSISELSESTDSVQLPCHIESPESLEFLGFMKEAAETIFVRFSQGSTSDPYASIIAYAKAYVHGVEDNSTADGDWNNVMTSVGIATWLRDAVLDAKYTHIRLTASAHFWILDTIEARYSFLVDLDN